MNELTIDGKIYISSKKAAEVTGYAKDYIGQLCREGHVEARMVGRSWYVLESSIRAHRFGGDPHAAPVETAPAAESEPASSIDTWAKPTYVPEPLYSMPVPVAQPAESPESMASAAETLTDMQSAWKEWFAQKQDTLIETPEIIDAREEEYEENKEEQAREDEIERNIQAFKDAHDDIDAAHHEEAQEEPVSIQAIRSDEPAVPESPAYEEIEAESEPVIIHHAAEPARVTYSREETVEAIPTKQERKRAAVQARKARRARKSSSASSFVVQAVLVAVILLVLAVTAIGTGYATRFMAGNMILRPVFDFLGGTSTYTK